MDCVLVFCLLVWLTKTPSALILLIGLAFNIVGTFLIAFSITFPHETRFEFDNDGKRAYVEANLPKFEKRFFKCGVFTLIMGFIFQFTGVFLELILS